MDHSAFNDSNEDLSNNSWHELTKSDYAKVVFCDLYTKNPDLSIGCRFQITDNVHEDPCDFIGLFQVGYESLSQCIVSKMLSKTECEENGKVLRCTFQRKELPKLKEGFYQFLYVTRDNEICGASTPFELKLKDDSSDDDLVDDCSEDDFLIVRSKLLEKNHFLETRLAEYKKNIARVEDQNAFLKYHLKKITKYHEEISANNGNNNENSTAELMSLLECLNKLLRDQQQQLDEAKNGRYQADALVEKLKIKLEKEQEKSKLLDAESKNFALDVTNRMAKLEEELVSSQTLVTVQKTQLEELQSQRKELLKKDLLLQTKLDQEREKNALLITELDLFSNERSKLEKTLMVEQLFHKSKGELYGLKCALADEKKLKNQSDEQLKILQAEIADLKHQLDKEKILNSEHAEEISKLNAQMNNIKEDIQEKDKKLFDYETEIPKLKLELEELKDKLSNKEESLVMQTRIAEELKNQLANLLEQKCNDDELSIKLNDLQANCNMWVEEVKDLRNLCEEMQDKLNQEKTISSQLKEGCIKKDAIIEYMAKENNALIKVKATLNEALIDREARIKEAENLYKQQYKEIMQLKKHHQLCQTPVKLPVNSMSGLSGAEKYTKALSLKSKEILPKASTTNDSDTGEHLLGNRDVEIDSQKKNLNKISHTQRKEVLKQLQEQMCKQLAGFDIKSEASKLSNSKTKQLVDKDITSLKEISNKECVPAAAKEEKEHVFIPCDLCKEVVKLPCDNVGPLMEEHMEKVHNQQMCPICGRLFDKNLPDKYFIYHVDDHYNLQAAWVNK